MDDSEVSEDTERGQEPASANGRSIRLPFEGVLEAIAVGIKSPWLLFGLGALLLLALLALRGTPLISSDLRLIVQAILFIFGVVAIGYFVNEVVLRPRSRRYESEDAKEAMPSPQLREPIEQVSISRPWVAVRDFQNESGRPKDEPQVFGVSSSLRGILETIPSDKYRFGVVPRSSLVGIRGDQISKRQIRARTGARFVLEGSLDLRADPVALEVELSSTSKEDSVLWKHTYVNSWADIQSTIRELAGNIVDEVLSRTRKEADPNVSESLSEITRRIDEIPKHPIDVFEAINQGVFYLNRFNNLREDDDYRDAAFYLNEAATMVDPKPQDALAQLGFLYILRWETNSDLKLLEKSKGVWEEIRRLNPRDPFSLAELGYITYVTQPDQAAAAIELALEGVRSDREHAIAQNVLALLYLYLGFYESNISIEKNKVFDLAPTYIYPRANAALAYQLLGAYDQALSLAASAREIEPEALVANLLVGAQYYYLGNYREADRAWSEGRMHSPEPVAPILDVALAWTSAASGDLDRAREAIKASFDAPWLTGPYGPYYISLCALAGDDDRALGLLQKEATFASSYRYLISEPTLGSLKNNPAFRSLLERRYEEWKRNLSALESELPNPIDHVLITPQQFLEQ